MVGFATVHDEIELRETWRQLEIRYRRESRCDDLVIAMLWLMGQFY